MKLWLFLLLSSSAIAQPLPTTPPLKEDTNLYYLNVAWDNVTNAQQYMVGTFSNSFLVAIVPAFTNWATVSNLPLVLNDFELRAYSIGLAGQSGYSDKAIFHWSTLLTSNDLTNWTKAPAVEFDYSSNACAFLRLSNWSYAAFLHRQ